MSHSQNVLSELQANHDIKDTVEDTEAANI